MSFLPDRTPDDTARPDRGIRLPSWDGAPVPLPREYAGPKRFGYLRIRRSRMDELEARIAELERQVEQTQGPAWPPEDVA